MIQFNQTASPPVADRGRRWRRHPGIAGDGLQAKMAMGQPQAPYFYRFKLGTAECTIVSDGQIAAWRPQRVIPEHRQSGNRARTEGQLPAHSNAVLEQNILVVNFGDRVVLFDTGMGGMTRCSATRPAR